MFGGFPDSVTANLDPVQTGIPWPGPGTTEKVAQADHNVTSSW